MDFCEFCFFMPCGLDKVVVTVLYKRIENIKENGAVGKSKVKK